MRAVRFEILLFLLCLFSFAYFHQGGGWNQNARFAEVRAIVEEGRLAIDDFLIYQRDPASPPGREHLRRLPLVRGEYTDQGHRFRLAWADMDWNLFPVGETAPAPGVTLAPLIEHCASGDIGFVPKPGEFHSNKPPGTSFVAVPIYWAIWHFERWRGIDPDDWWVLTVNAWLTAVGSVGFFSAIGCVLFFRLATEFAQGAKTPALLATLAFAFGTTFFSFGTMLFDHNLTATFLLAAFYFLHVPDARRGQVAEVSVVTRHCLVAGWCAGFATITNYLAIVPGIIFGIYALTGSYRSAGGRVRNWRAAVAYMLGVLPPFLLICWSGWVSFGSPFRLSTDFQNPLFKVTGGALGMFARPSAYVAQLLAISPFRGIFFLAPITALAAVMLLIWLFRRKRRLDAVIFLSIFGWFFLTNCSFNGYHGGFAAGPRYLIPGLPFLCLPLAAVFLYWRWLPRILLLVSVTSQLLLVATDAQNPLAVGGHARNDEKEDFFNNLIGDYAWPLFSRGRAWPMLEQLLAIHLREEKKRLLAAGIQGDELARQLAEAEQTVRGAIARGESSPLLLGAIVGPVSVNPVGIYEGLLTFGFYPPGAPQTRWNSFNVGEFIAFESRWSVVPLLLIAGGGFTWLGIVASREDRRRKI